jgi:hypothetical protein
MPDQKENTILQDSGETAGIGAKSRRKWARSYRDKNRSRIRDWDRAYLEKNREKINARRRELAKIKRESSEPKRKKDFVPKYATREEQLAEYAKRRREDRRNNPDKYRKWDETARKRKRKKLIENPLRLKAQQEKDRKRVAADRARNPKLTIRKRRQYKEKNKEKIKIQARAYRQQNKEKLSVNTWERLAKKKLATVGWYASEKDLIQTVFAKAAQYGWEVDHIVPIRSKIVCGLHTWANLQLLEATLNRRKSNRKWPDMP